MIFGPKDNVDKMIHGKILHNCWSGFGGIQDRFDSIIPLDYSKSSAMMTGGVWITLSHRLMRDYNQVGCSTIKFSTLYIRKSSISLF
jgi:hypothetical protein